MGEGDIYLFAEVCDEILWLMLNDRQRQIIQILKRMSKKTISNDGHLEEISDPKKEEIYESAQESMPNQPANSTKDKKETKLQIFISKIDCQFQKEMQEFLVQNKQSYNENAPKNICLYEDIMIIWSFKKGEDDLKKKKKDTIDKLAAELEGITNKKSSTIKERIQKKLSNLSVEEIKVYMSTKTDFSFNDKKQLNNRPKCLAISSKNSNSNEQNEPLPVVTAIKKEVKPVQTEAEINRYVEKKATKKVEQSSSKPPTSMFNRSIYKYGTKSTTQRIKFYYNPSTKTLLSFKESDLLKMKLASSQPSSSSQPQVKKETVQNANKPQQTRQGVIDIMLGEFKKDKQVENIPLNIDNFSKIKAQTNETIQILKKSEQTEQNMANLKKFQSLLMNIDQKMKQIQKEQNVVSAKQSQQEEDDHSQLSKNRQKEGKLASTGKKTLPEDSDESQKSKAPCLTMSQSEKKAQEQRLLRMVCNNVSYLEALGKNGADFRQYLWTQEEDNLLWSFKFSPNSYRQEMNCLLRYKSKAYILERMRFTNMQIDQKLLQDLQNLSCSQPEIIKCFQGPKKVEQESIENLDVGQPMQIEMKEKV